VAVFCEGLRGRLFKSGVHVLTIKPGFVDTPMTAHLSLPSLLVATQDLVARDIVRAVARRTDILYTPPYWAIIMLILRSIPSRIFKSMRL
jgi:decaprenylphospho-beta-D-erythro-pentofuranosid-2-ulose 2-reductase